MRVFISWSGEYSRRIALALRDWIPLVLHGVEPFVSSRDIYAGARWQADVAAELEISNFGIICVTGGNQTSPWLNFEAGALSKAVAVGRVIPLAIDLKPSDIKNPLGQFQAQPISGEGMLEVVRAVNSAQEKPLSESVVVRSVAKWWPELETEVSKALTELKVPSEEETSPRADRELLEELVDSVRSIGRYSIESTSSGNSPLRIWQEGEIEIKNFLIHNKVPRFRVRRVRQAVFVIFPKGASVSAALEEELASIGRMYGLDVGVMPDMTE